MPLGSIYVVGNGRIPSFHGCIIFHHVCLETTSSVHPLNPIHWTSICSSTDGHLGCFCDLAILMEIGALRRKWGYCEIIRVGHHSAWLCPCKKGESWTQRDAQRRDHGKREAWNGTFGSQGTPNITSDTKSQEGAGRKDSSRFFYKFQRVCGPANSLSSDFWFLELPDKKYALF